MSSSCPLWVVAGGASWRSSCLPSEEGEGGYSVRGGDDDVPAGLRALCCDKNVGSTSSPRRAIAWAAPSCRPTIRGASNCAPGAAPDGPPSNRATPPRAAVGPCSRTGSCTSHTAAGRTARAAAASSSTAAALGYLLLPRSVNGGLIPFTPALFCALVVHQLGVTVVVGNARCDILVPVALGVLPVLAVRDPFWIATSELLLVDKMLVYGSCPALLGRGGLG
ncbi:hypothetical protein CYMTET_9733 [Cymbomonas tetramitiformis]|uniref:Uncharacterized protein n=1 Tax=Cymbomonas tetramitiformis TaxID=36881 RepID=A0AAE0GQQ9_9CHLO|nr:hypothetical protein CYMTET_9733 [Cymbomonas tetramitiformis]